MELRKVTAIVQVTKLEEVEERLEEEGVSGITVTCIKGFGEYAEVLSPGWLTSHVRIEIFTTRDQAERLAKVIIDAAHTGLTGDGLVAVLPVERLFRIRTKAECGPGDF